VAHRTTPNVWQTAQYQPRAVTDNEHETYSQQLSSLSCHGSYITARLCTMVVVEVVVIKIIRLDIHIFQEFHNYKIMLH
jgi:hypothetical protein